MNLHKNLTTVTTFSKLLAMVLFIIFPILAFYYGSSYEKINSKIKADSWEFAREKYETKIKLLEEDFKLAVENRGKQIASSTSTYKHEDFGIYSPLFEGKTVLNTTYKYKGHKITSSRMSLDKKIGSVVTVWTFDTVSGNDINPPELFAIFDGYENYTIYPTLVSDLKKEWKDGYSTENNNMFWDYGRDPKGGISSLYLEVYQPYSPSGHPIFYRLEAPNDSPFGNPPSPELKEKLKRIVDTIPYRK